MDKSSHPYQRRDRTRRQQSPSQQPESPAKKLIIYVHDNQRKIGLLCDTYESTVALCRKIFPALVHATNVAFFTKDLDVCDGQLAEICSEDWKDIVGHIRNMVVVDQSPKSVIHDVPLRGRSRNQSQIFIRTFTGEILSLDLDPDFRIVDLKEQIQQVDGTPVTHQRLIFDGRELEDGYTLDDFNIYNGTTIDLMKRAVGGKPVIYLFAPDSLEASVELSLVPQWALSAIYPVTPIKPGPAGMGQTVSWRVRVHPEGHLTELSTGLDIAYLYWEALTNPPPPSSPPPSPHLGATGLELADKAQAFDPTNASLTDENAVIKSVKNITPYLDATLKALGLHIEARTSFITYWLPSLLKHEYVAFRFLPQASFEKAAPLRISPTPDIVTRVFMVFKGIKESELEGWSAAQRREEEDVASWIGIVGVDVGRTMDKALFRVIEWGESARDSVSDFRIIFYLNLRCAGSKLGSNRTNCSGYIWPGLFGDLGLTRTLSCQVKFSRYFGVRDTVAVDDLHLKDRHKITEGISLLHFYFNPGTTRYWLPGAYSDVGGSYARYELADISLFWMAVRVVFLKGCRHMKQGEIWNAYQPHNACDDTRRWMKGIFKPRIASSAATSPGVLNITSVGNMLRIRPAIRTIWSSIAPWRHKDRWNDTLVSSVSVA